LEEGNTTLFATHAPTAKLTSSGLTPIWSDKQQKGYSLPALLLPCQSVQEEFAQVGALIT